MPDASHVPDTRPCPRPGGVAARTTGIPGKTDHGVLVGAVAFVTHPRSMAVRHRRGHHSPFARHLAFLVFTAVGLVGVASHHAVTWAARDLAGLRTMLNKLVSGAVVISRDLGACKLLPL